MGSLLLNIIWLAALLVLPYGKYHEIHPLMLINSILTLTQTIIVNSTAVISYNVVIPPDLASHIVGVAINDDIYPLTANADAPMLYSGMAPGEASYRYVIVDSLENKVLLDFEKFQRPAINTLDRTYNEVFGRAWNQLSLPTIPKIYDYPYPVPESKLFEEGTIASIHFRADQAEIDKMHTQFQEEIKVKGVMTYIGFVCIVLFLYDKHRGSLFTDLTIFQL